MGVGYQAVQWNRQKKRYDAILLGGVVGFLAVFIGLGAVLFPNVTAETLIIRALALAAFVLLHVILMIGPLARLDDRFLPLLYNRRHMGVTMFVLALGHAVFSIIQFHALGDVNPFVSLLVSNTNFSSLAQFPFEQLGVLALFILFLMAATSHDFWLHNLTAPTWKRLHMLVYIAYALVVAHVVLGALQDQAGVMPSVLVAVGFVLVVGLQLVAGFRETKRDRPVDDTLEKGFVSVCQVDEIPEKRAKVVTIAGERVAVFKYDGKIAAVSNVCQHQNGPLGEGCVLDGFITCPWHGYQYIPETGASPPPFNERIPTFQTKLEGQTVLVSATPNPAGTRVEPSVIEARESG